MSTAFAAALQHHQDGKIEEALALYRQLSATIPDHGALWPLYGMAALQRGHWDEAENAFAEALRLNPQSAESHIGLGALFDARGQQDKAVDAYRMAAGLAPVNAEAWQNLGRLLYHAGRYAEAIPALKQFLSLRPGDADAMISLAGARRAMGDFAAAGQTLRQASQIAPENARLHFELGNLMLAVRKFPEAQGCFERAISYAPEIARYHSHMGLALEEQGQMDPALACQQLAVQLQPTQSGMHNNLGRLYRKLGRLDEAEACLRRAMQLSNRPQDYYSNLAVVLTELGRHAEAELLFAKTLAAFPDHHEAHMNMAQLQLRQGKFASGWTHYEHRWWGGERPVARRDFPFAEWQGQDLSGKTILIWGEQGPGDEILYTSMLPDLVARGAKLVVETEPRLTPLFRRSFPAATVVARANPADPATLAGNIDYQSAIASLGRYLRRDLNDFPAARSYLAGDAGLRDRLRARYRGVSGNLVVGISWRSKSKTFLAGKSSQLAEWASVLGVPGITFVNLQYGDCSAEITAIERDLGVRVVTDAEIDPLADMDAFAAQVSAMDLVISTSNTTVHVAGALGVPVWTLVPASQGLLWYWLEDRTDSPFYASMTLYRQSRNADWTPALDRVAADLKKIVMETAA